MLRKSKLSKQDKIKICKAYIDGEGSYAYFGNKYNCHSTTVRKWILLYKKYGSAVFDEKPCNSSYTKEFKLKVIKYYLDGKGSYVDIFLKFKVHPAVSSKWLNMYTNGIELKDYKPKGDVYVMANRKTSIEERKEIVKFVLDNNNDIKGASVKYNVKYATIYQWIKKYKELGDLSFRDSRGRPTGNKNNQNKNLTKEELLEIKIAELELENEKLERAVYAFKKKDEIESRWIKESIERKKHLNSKR